ncbi:MAG: hypothetical protein M1827_000890 [Pycnora praestabilis]|nr:MAG: hypothetical protein M1827_000890 [Pycnora praestabilis]
MPIPRTHFLEDPVQPEDKNASYTSSNTNRPISKRALTSYLTPYRYSSSLVKPALSDDIFENLAPVFEDDVYNPDPGRMIDVVLAKLLSSPAKSLPPECNRLLLHVLESYRNLNVSHHEVQKQLDEERADHEADMIEFAKFGELWMTEKEALVVEIQGLESVVRDGDSQKPGPIMSGPADTMVTEQSGFTNQSRGSKRGASSTLHVDDPLNSYKLNQKPEVLPIQISDHTTNVSYKRPDSPSHYMASLSRQYTSIDIDFRLPFGTSPSESHEPGLATIEDTPLKRGNVELSCCSTPRKEEGSSADSFNDDYSNSGGDHLPDEETEDGFMSEGSSFATTDLAVAMKTSKSLAGRKGLGAGEALAEVSKLGFGNERSDSVPTVSNSVRNSQEKPLPALPKYSEEKVLADRIAIASAPRKLSIRDDEGSSSGSPKLRLQNDEQTSRLRVFSFMPGDDSYGRALSRPGQDNENRKTDLKDYASSKLSIIDFLKTCQPETDSVFERVPPSSRPTHINTSMFSNQKSRIPSPSSHQCSLRRDHSGSSNGVITAIRENSGRSIVTVRRVSDTSDESHSEQVSS